MARLTWDSPTDRVFEAGIDRVVLYIDGYDGVAWSGVTSIDENFSGGEITGRYMDGVKYLNDVNGDEFTGSISAFTYPNIFMQCEGVASVKYGMYVSGQKKVPFGLSYRTKIGNQPQGLSLGYKIHILYNLTATSTQISNDTLNDNADATEFNWNITTVPPSLTGYRNSSHIIIDSRLTNAATLSAIEDILLGTDLAAARLPTLSELEIIYDENATVQVTDNGDGTFTVTGPDSAVSVVDADTFQLDWLSVELLTTDTYSVSSL